ncbi:MAG: TonB-dependent receptor [Sediminibacterium sp.]|nr:TonB-dependent receptor [Sediminibacterium sp.]
MKWVFILSGFLIIKNTVAQQTGGHIAGYISKKGYPMIGASIILSVNSHREKYTSNSDTNGYYHFTNIDAVGTYTLKVVTGSGDSTTLNGIEILVGETVHVNIDLQEKLNMLKDILVSSSIPYRNHSFGVRKADEMVKTNGIYGGIFQQFPQIHMMQNGGISIAQQNPRLNAIYIDGALQNDLFGLSANGIAGGQTLGFPIQAEEVEQVQVVSSSFDASIGNFTGGAINITTKAGTNKAQRKYFTERGLGNINQQRTGLQLSGPIVLNKIFYAGSIDYLKYQANEPFNLLRYRGNIQHIKQLELAANTIQSLYHYQIGKPEFVDLRKHIKLSLRIDWLLTRNQKLVFSVRHFSYERIHNNSSTPYSLFLSNSAKQFFGNVIYGNVEYKKWWKKNSNRLLLSIYKNSDNTSSGQMSFPAVRILDGAGMIYIGNQPDAMQNDIKQTQFFLYNKFQLEESKHTYSMGMEIHHVRIRNHFYPNSFGTYFYYSLADFIQNKKPGSYERDIYTQQTTPLSYSRAAIFLQIEKRFNSNWHVQAGLRITVENLANSPITNRVFNETILPSISSIHNIGNTQVGDPTKILPAYAPRISFSYENTKTGWLLQGGTGYFAGTIPLAWLSSADLFNGVNNNSFRAGNSSLKQLRFNPNPYVQWQPSQFSDSFSMPTINLISKGLKMPMSWKFTLLMKKNFKKNLSIQTDFLFFMNKEEMAISNIALPSPTIQLSGPDQRLVYDSNTSVGGYQEIYFLRNNEKQNGYGYQFQVQLRKQINFSTFNVAYLIGDAFTRYDGNFSLLSNQWKLNESVRGRNNLSLARSDFSIGQIIQCRFYRAFKLAKHQLGLQIEYHGRSGSPFSYVYGEKSMVQDAINTPGFDLIYIPTKKDLEKQLFVPIISEQYYYTAEVQKELLNSFIDGNAYLNKRRGLYAERNGSRHPFFHQCNLNLSYDVSVKLYRNKMYLHSYISIFNIQAWINKTINKTNLFGKNQVKLIHFMGYTNGNYTPTYSIDPNLLFSKGLPAPTRVSPEMDQFPYIKAGLKLSFY